MNPALDYHPPDEAFGDLLAVKTPYREPVFSLERPSYRVKAGACQKCGALGTLFLHAGKRVWRCGSCLPADRRVHVKADST